MFCRIRTISIIISVFASRVVDRGFKPGRVNSRTDKLVFDASLLSKQHQGERGRTGWLGMRKMCPSKATCLPMDCCFSHLAPYKSIKRVGLIQSRQHHHLIECHLLSPWNGWRKQQSLTDSLKRLPCSKRVWIYLLKKNICLLYTISLLNMRDIKYRWKIQYIFVRKKE
jgi:hypothetical protein